MALDYNQVSAVTKKYFVPKMSDVVFDSNPLTKRSKTRFMEMVDGGERAVLPLGYASTTASGWYDGYDTLDTTGNDQLTGAALTWKQLYASITISGREERQNSGKSAVLRLLKQKTKMAEKTMRDSIGTGLYSNATNAKSIVGLRKWVDTSSTVGGISQTTYSWWAGQLDSSTTTLSLYAMQSKMNAATVDDDKPTVCMTTRTIYDLLFALYQPQQRFVDAETAKGGFSSLMFSGIPVIADSKCPASNMFILNENYLSLMVHKDENMKFEDFRKPINQNAHIARILWFGAFGSSNNRLHGRLSAITA